MFIVSTIARKLVLLLLSLFVIGCSNTAVIDSWHEPGYQQVYVKPMIIGVSDSQQTRRIFENHLASELKKRGTTAVPSYTLISSKQKLDRDTVVATVAGTDIDAVLITYLVAADSKVVQQSSPLSGGYSGSVDANQVSATLISTRGRTDSAEVVTLKNDLYDAEKKDLVWSVQTRSTAPASIDEVVTDVTAILVERLYDDGFLK